MHKRLLTLDKAEVFQLSLLFRTVAQATGDKQRYE